MRLILAEKPSVARDIAKALGAEKVGAFFQKGDTLIAHALGHLYEIDKTLAPTPWRLEDLPILPQVFRYVPREGRGVKELLRELKGALSRAKEVVIATDPGREGELKAFACQDEKTGGLLRKARHRPPKTASLTPLSSPATLQNMRAIGKIAREEGVSPHQLYNFYARFLGRKQGKVKGKDAEEREKKELHLMAQAIRLFRERNPNRKNLDVPAVYRVYRELGGIFSPSGVGKGEPTSSTRGVRAAELSREEAIGLLEKMAVLFQMAAQALEKEKAGTA